MTSPGNNTVLSSTPPISPVCPGAPRHQRMRYDMSQHVDVIERLDFDDLVCPGAPKHQRMKYFNISPSNRVRRRLDFGSKSK